MRRPVSLPSLYCPFPPEIHPEAAWIHERSVLWAQSLGILPTERHIETARKAKTGWLVARAFPTATTNGLQLAADWMVLFCAIDDHTEKLERATEVEAYLQYLLGLFRANVAGFSEDPFALGMMDLGKRLLTLGSSNHFTRFTDRLRELFAGNVTEARNRETARVPGLASYLRLREVTIGLHAMFALSELLEGFNLSESARNHPALQRLATRASHIVGWTNDLFTYKKEVNEGEIHNLVTVLMNEHQLSLQDAVAHALSLHDAEMQSFLHEVKRLPAFGLADTGLQKYVMMLKSWIRGHLDWAHETERYLVPAELM